MDPVGSIMRDGVAAQPNFALLICAAFTVVAVGAGCDGPTLAKGSVYHGPPYVAVAILPHLGVRLLDEREQAGCVRYMGLPVVGIVPSEVAGDAFDQGAVFHGRQNARCTTLFLRIGCEAI